MPSRQLDGNVGLASPIAPHDPANLRGAGVDDVVAGVVGMESGAQIGEKVQGAAWAVYQGRFRAEDGGLSNAGGMGQLAGVPFEVIVDIEGIDSTAMI